MDQRTLGPTHLRVSEPEVLAAQLWSFVHGYITLELAELFAEFDDPVAQVLVPMGVNLVVGLGDERERIRLRAVAFQVSELTVGRLLLEP